MTEKTQREAAGELAGRYGEPKEAIKKLRWAIKASKKITRKKKKIIWSTLGEKIKVQAEDYIKQRIDREADDSLDEPGWGEKNQKHAFKLPGLVGIETKLKKTSGVLDVFSCLAEDDGKEERQWVFVIKAVRLVVHMMLLVIREEEDQEQKQAYADLFCALGKYFG